MTELLLLLVIVSWTVVAWFVYQYFNQNTEADSLPDDARIAPLLKGLNYLLSEKPDEAIRELVDIARIHTETAEVYLAIGGLFRMRGEIGRAIRIHQSILARSGISDDIRLQASMALASDFQAGGFRSRALKQLDDVLGMQSGHQAAIEAVLRIREQAHEWREAEALLMKLDRDKNSSSVDDHRAYLVSEMAREMFEEGDIKQARKRCVQAIHHSEKCASAHVLLIRMVIQANDFHQAMRLIHDFSRACSPEFLPLIVSDIVRCKPLYEEKGMAFLKKQANQANADHLILAWLDAVTEEHGADAASELMKELNYRPRTIQSLLYLGAMDILFEDHQYHWVFSQWYNQVKSYACQNCGVSVVEMRWQCPQCYHWGSMHPITGDI